MILYLVDMLEFSTFWSQWNMFSMYEELSESPDMNKLCIQSGSKYCPAVEQVSL